MVQIYRMDFLAKFEVLTVLPVPTTETTVLFSLPALPRSPFFLKSKSKIKVNYDLYYLFFNNHCNNQAQQPSDTYCCDHRSTYFTISMDSSFAPFAITFLSGASYGLTTVIVGQPLDTVKTRMQGLSSSSASHILRDLYSKEGIRGLYRGGLPLMLGGSIMRSAQFGVSAKAREVLEETDFPRYVAFNTLDSNVLLAGIAGGVGRATIEIPTDFLKIRRQIIKDLNAKMDFSMLKKNLMDGSLVTFGRNTILFSSFIVYVDLSKQACTAGLIPKFLCNEESTGLTPFAKGALCANLAWLTCWPFDVIKTQRQSGNFAPGIGAIELLRENMKQGKLFRGLVPGLVRSTFANGSSMVVYETVHTHLSGFFEVQRKDLL